MGRRTLEYKDDSNDSNIPLKRIKNSLHGRNDCLSRNTVTRRRKVAKNEKLYGKMTNVIKKRLKSGLPIKEDATSSINYNTRSSLRLKDSCKQTQGSKEKEIVEEPITRKCSKSDLHQEASKNPLRTFRLHKSEQHRDEHQVEEKDMCERFRTSLQMSKVLTLESNPVQTESDNAIVSKLFQDEKCNEFKPQLENEHLEIEKQRNTEPPFRSLRSSHREREEFPFPDKTRQALSRLLPKQMLTELKEMIKLQEKEQFEFQKIKDESSFTILQQIEDSPQIYEINQSERIENKTHQLKEEENVEYVDKTKQKAEKKEEISPSQSNAQQMEESNSKAYTFKEKKHVEHNPFKSLLSSQKLEKEQGIIWDSPKLSPEGRKQIENSFTTFRRKYQLQEKAKTESSQNRIYKERAEEAKEQNQSKSIETSVEPKRKFDKPAKTVETNRLDQRSVESEEKIKLPITSLETLSHACQNKVMEMSRNKSKTCQKTELRENCQTEYFDSSSQMSDDSFNSVKMAAEALSLLKSNGRASTYPLIDDYVDTGPDTSVEISYAAACSASTQQNFSKPLTTVKQSDASSSLEHSDTENSKNASGNPSPKHGQIQQRMFFDTTLEITNAATGAKVPFELLCLNEKTTEDNVTEAKKQFLSGSFLQLSDSVTCIKVPSKSRYGKFREDPILSNKFQKEQLDTSCANTLFPITKRKSNYSTLQKDGCDSLSNRRVLSHKIPVKSLQTADEGFKFPLDVKKGESHFSTTDSSCLTSNEYYSDNVLIPKFNQTHDSEGCHKPFENIEFFKYEEDKLRSPFSKNQTSNLNVELQWEGGNSSQTQMTDMLKNIPLDGRLLSMNKQIVCTEHVEETKTKIFTRIPRRPKTTKFPSANQIKALALFPDALQFGAKEETSLSYKNSELPFSIPSIDVNQFITSATMRTGKQQDEVLSPNSPVIKIELSESTYSCQEQEKVIETKDIDTKSEIPFAIISPEIPFVSPKLVVNQRSTDETVSKIIHGELSAFTDESVTEELNKQTMQFREISPFSAQKSLSPKSPTTLLITEDSNEFIQSSTNDKFGRIDAKTDVRFLQQQRVELNKFYGDSSTTLESYFSEFKTSKSINIDVKLNRFGEIDQFKSIQSSNRNNVSTPNKHVKKERRFSQDQRVPNAKKERRFSQYQQFKEEGQTNQSTTSNLSDLQTIKWIKNENFTKNICISPAENKRKCSGKEETKNSKYVRSTLDMPSLEDDETSILQYYDNSQKHENFRKRMKSESNSKNGNSSLEWQITLGNKRLRTTSQDQLTSSLEWSSFEQMETINYQLSNAVKNDSTTSKAQQNENFNENQTALTPSQKADFLRTIKTPLEAFSLLINDDMIGRLLKYTNAKLESLVNRSKHLSCFKKPTNQIELKAFLGLLLISGALKHNQTTVKEIWSECFGAGIYRATLNESRFKGLSQGICFDDYSSRDRSVIEYESPHVGTLWEEYLNNCKQFSVTSHLNKKNEHFDKSTKCYNKTGEDKLSNMYSTARRTVNMPLRLMFNMLDGASVAGLRIFRFSNPSVRMCHREFLKQIGMGLIRPHLHIRLKKMALRKPIKELIQSILNKKNDNDQGPSSQVDFLMEKQNRCQLCSWQENRKTEFNCVSCQRPMCKEHRSYLCTDCIC